MQHVAYYRVSTTQQGESGLGLAAQKELVQRFVGNVPLLAELPSGARYRDVIGSLLVEPDGQELPQRERIGEAPRDAALAVESFKEADHHDAEILARRQGWTSELVVIEIGAVGFTEEVELGVVENFVQPLVERVARCCGQLPAVPQVLLPLSHLPGAHRHSSIVESKHF